ncbi:MAG: hypothetical protein JXB88_23150 [Spirochaetales bacterium]|nr:hypothetical protein [Spirochaetales bacterium]
MKIIFAHRNTGSIIGAVLYLFLTGGCMTTSIVDLEIRDMDVKLQNASEDTVSSVVPGKKYRLKVAVTDSRGKTINHPSPEDLIISSTNHTFINIEKNMYVTGTPYTLVFTQIPGYSLTIKVKDNPYMKTMSWPVAWDEFNTLDFSGKPGENGIEGQDGLDGAPSYGVADGNDGSDGWDGTDGKKGWDITVLVLYYNREDKGIMGINDRTMLFIADITNKKEYLLKRNNIIINVSGGDGGDGGKGGDAGAGAEYTDSDTEGISSRKKGKDGEPGTGGNGGDGGDGGTIQVLYMDDAIPVYITAITKGGAGGEAGEHGETATFGTFWNRSFNHDGKSGKDGEYIKKKISAEQARALCAFIEDPYFEPGKVLLE